MDYILELAEHPDLVEALQWLERLTATKSEASVDGVTLERLTRFAQEGVKPHSANGIRVRVRELLNDKKELRQRYPHAWMNEVIHALYANPLLTALVWRCFRYCAGFTRRLAKQSQSPRFGLDPAALDRFLHRWRPGGSGERGGETRELVRTSGEPVDDEVYLKRIDLACHEHDVYPSPPRLFVDLLSAMGTKRGQWHDKTMYWLAHPSELRKDAAAQRIAVPFSFVLDSELNQIEHTRGDVKAGARPHSNSASTCSHKPSTDEHPLRRALRSNLLGLAFSGGGIRSATFNLGTLQALASFGLLKRCDYLSTVSGGGYIGSWLAAWILRESQRVNAETGKAQTPNETIDEIQRCLSPTRSPNPMDQRERPIRYLREYSNYLTPNVGFLSSDTWTMAGIVLRNAILNQVTIVSMLAFLLLLPRLWAALLTSLQDWPVWSGLICWGFGAIALIANLRRLEAHRSVADNTATTPRVRVAPPRFARPLFIHGFVVLPWVLGAALLARLAGARALTEEGTTFAFLGFALSPPVWVFAGMFTLSFGTLLLGGTHRFWTQGQSASSSRRTLNAMFGIVLASLAGGLVAGALVAALLPVLGRPTAVGTWSPSGVPNDIVWQTVGIDVVLILAIVSLSIIAILGMLGGRFPDEHREWWSRLRTCLHVWTVSWLLWFTVALYVPQLLQGLAKTHYAWEAGTASLIAWIATTILGVRNGRTADANGLSPDGQSRTPGGSAVSMRYVVLIAPYVFIAGLVVAVSWGIDRIFLHHYSAANPGNSAADYWHYATWTTTGGGAWTPIPMFEMSVSWTALCWIVLLGIGILFSWRVGINEFSIHHFYKNRLVRCYLGASRRDRKADWFTGFDPRDDIRLRCFDSASGENPYPGPYPIFNCALNLVAGRDLAWQERKAASFAFTPKYCGYDVDRSVLDKVSEDDGFIFEVKSHRFSHDALQSEGYVPTASYHDEAHGPLLGMAMAISGAAANPSMGRATSSASAFLLAVFNVRLGWWIGNPRLGAAVPRHSPKFGLAYTALELFSGTDDRRDFVNLSDGGHFDNLGVYELVRRGCRYIILSDAGQDGDMRCEDLGNLVRRCRTDFGVDIDIAVDQIQRASGQPSRAHCVVGTIHYRNVPRRDEEGRLLTDSGEVAQNGERPGHEVGYLVYLKPSLTGDEPQDVAEYARRDAKFPHQTTADQWFSESQFESYRQLGMHIGQQVFARYLTEEQAADSSIRELFTKLHRYWYPPSLDLERFSTEHAKAYARIMTTVHENAVLEPLDHVIFDRLPVSDPNALRPRDEFFLCNSLIDLIEMVYRDLDLEHDSSHPHVEGWMKLFRRWVAQPAFDRTWRVSQTTYSRRFREFYNDVLGGDPDPLHEHFVIGFREQGPPFSEAATPAEATTKHTVRADHIVVEWKDSALVVSRGHSALRTSEHQSDAHELKQVRASSFAEYLRRPHSGVLLLVELADSSCAVQVYDELKAAEWLKNEYIIFAANQESLADLKRHASDVNVGLVVTTSEVLEPLICNANPRVDYILTRVDDVSDEMLTRAGERRIKLIAVVPRDTELARLKNHPAVAGVIVGTRRP